MFLVFLWMLITLMISVWNAHVVGRYWTEKGQLPGGTGLLMWAGAVMATCGFFAVYVIMITMVMYDTNAFPFLAEVMFEIKLEPAEVDTLVQNIFDLAYLMIIFPVLGSGFVITAHSWAVAYRRRDLLSGGIAGYNTGAQVYNTYRAVKNVPQATSSLFSGIGKSMKSKDSGKAMAMLILFLFPVIISLGGAVVTTAVIIRASDQKYDLDEV